MIIHQVFFNRIKLVILKEIPYLQEEEEQQSDH
jgi:hypothetical protein